MCLNLDLVVSCIFIDKKYKYIFALQTIGDKVVGKEMKVVVEFTNPLKKKLQNVVLRIGGPGLMNTKTQIFR